MMTLVLRSHLESRSKRGAPPVVAPVRYAAVRRRFLPWRAVVVGLLLWLVQG